MRLEKAFNKLEQLAVKAYKVAKKANGVTHAISITCVEYEDEYHVVAFIHDENLNILTHAEFNVKKEEEQC